MHISQAEGKPSISGAWGNMGMDRAGGFEPPIAGPKPAALPLGYARSRGWGEAARPTNRLGLPAFKPSRSVPLSRPGFQTHWREAGGSKSNSAARSLSAGSNGPLAPRRVSGLGVDGAAIFGRACINRQKLCPAGIMPGSGAIRKRPMRWRSSGAARGWRIDRSRYGSGRDHLD